MRTPTAHAASPRQPLQRETVYRLDGAIVTAS